MQITGRTRGSSPGAQLYTASKSQAHQFIELVGRAAIRVRAATCKRYCIALSLRAYHAQWRVTALREKEADVYTLALSAAAVQSTLVES